MAAPINPWSVVTGDTDPSAAAGLDISQPPEGIPPAYWNKVLNDPRNADAVRWIRGGRKSSNLSRFSSPEDWLKFATNATQQEYAALPDKDKQDYENAKDGIDPHSVQAEQNYQRDLIEKNQGLDDVDWGNVNFDETEGAIRDAAAGNKGALEHLNEIINGIKDPALASYVGDYTAHLAGADPRDIEAQQRQLAKLEGLSDPTITAEEKLMNEMARRKTEGDLRAQRGAIKNDLLSRGVYGSGAELTQNAMAQQEAAQRQAYEMMQANANAQSRAMKALEGAADLSTSMRGSSAQESQYNAGAMNLADQFNKKLLESYNDWKDRTQKENNDREIARQTTVAGNVGKIGAGGVQAANDIFTGRGAAAAKKTEIRHNTVKDLLGVSDDAENYYDTDHTKKEVAT